MKTIIGVNDPKAVKKYSVFLATDASRKSYFNKKFMGVGVDANTPIQTLLNLENDAGDTISFDLSMQLRMQPIEGDKVLRGKEEDLKFYSDSVSIDQMRGGVNTGGKMSRKRTIHDLRKIARMRQSEWWARVFDELFFMYLSGRRGVNADYIFPTDYTGSAGNAFVAPDALHNLFGGSATSKATLTAADKMDLKLIDKAVARASTMGGGTTGVPQIEPCDVGGEGAFVLCLHPFQAYDLRVDTGAAGWLEIQKAAAAADGQKSPIMMGKLGMHNGVVLHEHRSINMADDFGAGSNVESARALFMGRQAAVVAFGSGGSGLRFDWNEEQEDRGNQVVITTSSIFGMKKTAFTINGTSRDFGLLSLDTAVTDPTA